MKKKDWHDGSGYIDIDEETIDGKSDWSNGVLGNILSKTILLTENIRAIIQDPDLYSTGSSCLWREKVRNKDSYRVSAVGSKEGPRIGRIRPITYRCQIGRKNERWRAYMIGFILIMMFNRAKDDSSCDCIRPVPLTTACKQLDTKLENGKLIKLWRITWGWFWQPVLWSPLHRLHFDVLPVQRCHGIRWAK